MVREKKTPDDGGYIDRRTVLQGTLGAALAIGLATGTQRTSAEKVGAGDWPMFQYDVSRVGHSPSIHGPKADITERWRSPERGLSVSPVVVGDTVYTANDVKVNARNANTGNVNWDFEPSGQVWVPPAVVDGSVYFGDVVLDDETGSVYALDAGTGKEQWRFETNGLVRSSPAVVDETVYIGSDDQSLYALDTETGSERWRFTTGDIVAWAPAIADDTVYVGSLDDNVYALDRETGFEKWRFKTDYRAREVAVAGGTVYAASSDDALYALDASTGEKRWVFETNGFVMTSPTVAYETVYVGSGDNHLYAIDVSDGTLRWKFEPAPARFQGVPSSPAVADGVIYFGSYDHHIYALNANDGTVIWKHDVGAPAGSTDPAIIDSTVFVGNRDSELIAIEGTPAIEIVIDISPGTDKNAINSGDRGVVPVAVLHTEEFDPADRVDVDTLRFGDPDVVDTGNGASPAHGGHVEDIDDDDDDDLVLHFPTRDTGFDEDEETGKLVGETTDGVPLYGTDSVELVNR